MLGLRAAPIVHTAPIIMAVAMAMACSRRPAADNGPAPNNGAGATEARLEKAPSTSPGAAPAPDVAFDVLRDFAACSLEHHGALLDFGDATMRARSFAPRPRGAKGKVASEPAFRREPSGFDSQTNLIQRNANERELESRERDGASWAVVRDRTLTATFLGPRDLPADTPIVVEARVRGGTAKSAAVYLNGRALGTLALEKGATTTSATRAASPPASPSQDAPYTDLMHPGQNELLFRFNGSSKTTSETLAEIDWVRIGPADTAGPYAAPTRADVLATPSINGVAKRAVSLRAPGSVRCGAHIPAGARLEGWVGVLGGEATAEVRVLTDAAPPHVVGNYVLRSSSNANSKTPDPQGTDSAASGWIPVSLPLGDHATLGQIQLVAKQSSKGARVVFAEPRIVTSASSRPSPNAAQLAEPTVSQASPSHTSPATAPSSAASASRHNGLPGNDSSAHAKSVVVVVLGSVARSTLALYGGALRTPELDDVAASGTIFHAHRASSSIASSAFTSMLTGLLPFEHRVLDSEAILAASVTTLGEAARHAGMATALFTANPTTSAPYGFANGWETVGFRNPTDDAPSTAVFDDAEQWLDSHKDDRFVLVVHARGGHPPWDIPPRDTELDPPGYTGGLDPKHAAELFAKLRASSSSAAKPLSEADRRRAVAFYHRAIALHAAAVGRLNAKLREHGRDRDTAVFITSDVAADPAMRIPFLDDDRLDESQLALPLIARGPGFAPGARVIAPTSSVQIARTVLDSLGLPPLEAMQGPSLHTSAPEDKTNAFSLQIAQSTTRFSARWADFLMVGDADREARFCALSPDTDATLTASNTDAACASDARPSHPIAAEILQRRLFETLARSRSRSGSQPDANRGGMVSHVTADATTAAALRIWGISAGMRPHSSK